MLKEELQLISEEFNDTFYLDEGLLCMVTKDENTATARSATITDIDEYFDRIITIQVTKALESVRLNEDDVQMMTKGYHDAVLDLNEKIEKYLK